MSQDETLQSCNLHKDSVTICLVNLRLKREQIFERVAYNYNIWKLN